jgi:hypothetical protein
MDGQRLHCIMQGHLQKFRSSERPCFCTQCKVCASIKCKCEECGAVKIEYCTSIQCVCPSCNRRDMSRCTSSLCKCMECGNKNTSNCTSKSCRCQRCGRKAPDLCKSSWCQCMNCWRKAPDLCTFKYCKCPHCGKHEPHQPCLVQNQCQCTQCHKLLDKHNCQNDPTMSPSCPCQRWIDRPWKIANSQLYCLDQKIAHFKTTFIYADLSPSKTSPFYGLQVFWAWQQQLQLQLHYNDELKQQHRDFQRYKQKTQGSMQSHQLNLCPSQDGEKPDDKPHINGQQQLFNRKLLEYPCAVKTIAESQVKVIGDTPIYGIDPLTGNLYLGRYPLPIDKDIEKLSLDVTNYVYTSTNLENYERSSILLRSSDKHLTRINIIVTTEVTTVCDFAKRHLKTIPLSIPDQILEIFKGSFPIELFSLMHIIMDYFCLTSSMKSILVQVFPSPSPSSSS